MACFLRGYKHYDIYSRKGDTQQETFNMKLAAHKYNSYNKDA
jgi:hypothetical protein